MGFQRLAEYSSLVAVACLRSWDILVNIQKATGIGCFVFLFYAGGCI